MGVVKESCRIDLRRRSLKALEQRPQYLMADIPDLKRDRGQLRQLPGLDQIAGDVILRVLLVIILSLAAAERRVPGVRPPEHVRVSKLSNACVAQICLWVLVR